MNRYIPPIVIDGLLSMIRPFSGFSGRYPSFGDVRGRVRGYEDPRIVRHYEASLRSALANWEQESTQLMEARKIRVLAAMSLASQKSKSQSLILSDVGGGWGRDYFHLAHHLPDLTKWVVVETPSVVARLAKVDSLPSKLSFESELRQLARQGSHENHIIYASGFIQCVPAGLSALSDFAQASRFVVLDRVPLIEGDDSFVAIQRTMKILGGVGSSYASWFFSERDFHETVSAHWRVSLSWEVPEDRPVIQRSRRPYQGFLLERL